MGYVSLLSKFALCESGVPGRVFSSARRFVGRPGQQTRPAFLFFLCLPRVVRVVPALSAAQSAHLPGSVPESAQKSSKQKRLIFCSIFGDGKNGKVGRKSVAPLLTGILRYKTHLSKIGKNWIRT